ncbi:putative methyltransferase-domain-containing protein [Lophiotrema nucula]|uniref:Putative methyltransferase-domain-containing protein n=1 Tax=Lophiotrema nucula TaxID=690887 RepID=A0A6A5YZV5_9PLEO|nr:putative methyltransferase-domain-containing protein [Lophiotrema nucula]
MGVPGQVLPPSSSLPPVRALTTAVVCEEEVVTALHNLRSLYCPLRLPQSVHKPRQPSFSVPAIDSGYASEDEDENPFDTLAADTAISNLRLDEFERTIATRWLTTLIACAESIEFETEDAREKALNYAAFILSSFSDSIEDPEEEALTRIFDFATNHGDVINVRLNDAPLSGTDHTDVGMQSWGASIVMSDMLCADPQRFGISTLNAGSTVVELGAGTGLVGLTLGKLLPTLGLRNSRIIATDYHSAVLSNLEVNIGNNFPSDPVPPVKAHLLDWSNPKIPDSIPVSVRILVAADVVYAKEHAVWLRDCAGRLLGPDGTFWLMVTVREHGKFQGIASTVEAAFVEKKPATHDGRELRILEKERVEKRRGIGRGDEVCYFLYRIGWTSM